MLSHVGGIFVRLRVLGVVQCDSNEIIRGVECLSLEAFQDGVERAVEKWELFFDSFAGNFTGRVVEHPAGDVDDEYACISCGLLGDDIRTRDKNKR